MRNSGFQDVEFENITENIKQNWPMNRKYLFRLSRAIFFTSSHHKNKPSKEISNHFFLKAHFRLWAAYKMGILQYGIFTGHKA